MPRSLHVRKVLNLYKTILRLHQHLPADLRSVGDKYVKSEFRLHKTAEDQFVKSFLAQWEEYKKSLEVQAVSPDVSNFYGSNLTTENLDQLSEDQLLQLYELKTYMESKSKRRK